MAGPFRNADHARMSDTDLKPPQAYWTQPASELIAALHTRATGLSSAEAWLRLKTHGFNDIKPRRVGALGMLLAQFRNPMTLILLFAASVALVARDWVNATIVLVIVIGSGVLSFVQEFRASNAMQRLLRRIALTTTVLRNGRPEHVLATHILPGDILLLAAGSLIPADGVVLEAADFFVNEAALTGETYPTEKLPGTAAADAALGQRGNCVFMGTSVRSGTAKVLVVCTGRATEYGRIAQRIAQHPPEAEFERGIRRLGYLLTRLMLVIVVVVFTVNLLLHRPPLESLLFVAALAVGLSPELLPAILTVTLARGAQRMAARGVIVRRLNAIENLGAMSVLCSDKTGTLTEGVIQLNAAVDSEGRPSEEVRRLAFINATLQTGLPNPLDETLVNSAGAGAAARWSKLDEIPYDFMRRRLTIVIRAEGRGPEAQLVTKGAFENVLACCTQLDSEHGPIPLDAPQRRRLQEQFIGWSRQGYRVLGVASARLPLKNRYERADESGLSFAGFLLFFDPPKAGTAEVLAKLAALGVQLKMLTGDNRHVAQHIAAAVGMSQAKILSGAELDGVSQDALPTVAAQTDIFAEVDPQQKERIVSALRRAGRVVGYLGDGINDAPAMHAADTAISVDRAVDIARESADFVLLQHDLEVLRQGIEEGRNTFANTMKYIFMSISGKFGNMLSMSAASLFMPFLPMLPKQILLNNFLADLPAVAIADDRVDPELTEQPRRWNIRRVRDLTVVFGLINSSADFVSFGVLLGLAHAPPALFRSGWFIENLLTELAIIMVIRSQRPFWRSRPGAWLVAAALLALLVVAVTPFPPLSRLFGFVPLPPWLLAAVLAITTAYVMAVEVVKRVFGLGLGALGRPH